MTPWFKTSYRRNLVDMHVEDWHEEFLSQFDPEAYFAALIDAGVQSTMIYIQSFLGYCYWPTKNGRMHRAFRGRETAMRHLFELCRSANVSVVAYYTLNFNNWAYATYPDWRMLDVTGRPSRATGSRYGVCCPNHPGYRQFVSAQIEEFCQFFDFQGVFFDMTFWPMVCYCNSCRERWAREVGGDMPTVVDWRDPRWLAFQERRENWIEEFAKQITAELKTWKPHCSVEHQNSSATSFWRLGVHENTVQASDYCGGDLYGGLDQHSFACKLYYHLSQNQPFEYMTSRCDPDLTEHTATKSTQELWQSVALTLAHHGASLFIDAIDPKGTLDRRVYRQMGEVFAKAQPFEPYLQGELVRDVGVYYSLRGKMNVDAPPVDVGTPAQEDREQPHLKAALGAAKTLQMNHIPFGVVSNWPLESLDRLTVLVLPDVPAMDKVQMAAVTDFVENGGALYLSGHSAPKLVETFFGATLAGFTEETVTYMAPTPVGAYLMPEFTTDFPMTIFARQMKLSGHTRGDVLATMTLPYTVPAPHHRFGDIGLADKPGIVVGAEKAERFASVHSDPPGRATNLPSLMRTSYGRGQVWWSAAPVEAARPYQHRRVFARIIQELGGSFAFRSTAPPTVELVMFFVPAKNRYLVSLVNVLEQGELEHGRACDVVVKTGKTPRRVALLPHEEDVPYRYANGEVTIRLDSFAVLTMLAIDCTLS